MFICTRAHLGTDSILGKRDTNKCILGKLGIGVALAIPLFSKLDLAICMPIYFSIISILHECMQDNAVSLSTHALGKI